MSQIPGTYHTWYEVRYDCHEQVKNTSCCCSSLGWQLMLAVVTKQEEAYLTLSAPNPETLARRASVRSVDGEPHPQAGDQQSDPGSMFPAHALSVMYAQALNSNWKLLFTANPPATCKITRACSRRGQAIETLGEAKDILATCNTRPSCTWFRVRGELAVSTWCALQGASIVIFSV